ncbi:GLRX1 protein, partial [Glareola pratincola]|nr:GLRX1 protein [Glareola pratincola]
SMATYVWSRLRDDKVTVFTKVGCPYCRNALELLKYVCTPGCLQVFDITGMEDVQDYFQQTTGQRTVPRIFFGKHCIGGLSDLERMRYKLPAMLQRIGARK